MKYQIETTKDGSSTLRKPNGEYYHSLHGALTESNHVFIKHGLSYFVNQSGNSKVNVLEMGLGSGLNALLSQLHAENNGITINYTAVELHPLPTSMAANLNFEEALQLQGVNKKLEQILKCENDVQTKLSDTFIITIWHKALEDFFPSQFFDVIYYDAFAPTAQPELWTIEIFKKLYAMLNNSGILTTYCAKGQVKRDLRAAGFVIESLPGPPGKREMTRAIKSIK